MSCKVIFFILCFLSALVGGVPCGLLFVMSQL
nr:MAG TPA: hypothetical protein [Caudoviricetes sp.]